jgi:hypothetical protein
MKIIQPIALSAAFAVFGLSGVFVTHRPAQRVWEDGLLMSEQSQTASNNWIQLMNRYGWKIRYPPNWKASGHENTAPANDDAPTIVGPGTCYRQRCGNIQIQVQDLERADAVAAISACEYVKNSVSTTTKIVLTREFEIAGEPACEVVFTTGGILNRLIGFKHRNQGFLIGSWESGASSSDDIKSPADWRLTELFDKIMSTFSFTDRK